MDLFVICLIAILFSSIYVTYWLAVDIIHDLKHDTGMMPILYEQVVAVILSLIISSIVVWFLIRIWVV